MGNDLPSIDLAEKPAQTTAPKKAAAVTCAPPKKKATAERTAAGSEALQRLLRDRELVHEARQELLSALADAETLRPEQWELLTADGWNSKDVQDRVRVLLEARQLKSVAGTSAELADAQARSQQAAAALVEKRPGIEEQVRKLR